MVGLKGEKRTASLELSVLLVSVCTNEKKQSVGLRKNKTKEIPIYFFYDICFLLIYSVSLHVKALFKKSGLLLLLENYHYKAGTSNTSNYPFKLNN